MIRRKEVAQVERWQPVVGFEGRYEVSDHGRVRNVFCRGRPRARLLRPGITTDRGTQQVWLYHSDGRKVGRFVHHLVLEAFVGSCPPGLIARHLDDNGAHNHVKNLKWGTHVENVADAFENEKRPVGEAHPQHKVSDACVHSIRQRVAAGETCTQLAREFGLNKSTTARYVRGTSRRYS